MRVETQGPRPHLRLSESESPKHLTSFFRGTGKTHGHLVERADVPSRSPRGTRRSKAALNLFWSKDPLGAREGPVRGRRGRPCKRSWQTARGHVGSPGLSVDPPSRAPDVSGEENKPSEGGRQGIAREMGDQEA